MQEILITFLLFGLAVLLGFTRSKDTPPASKSNRKVSTKHRSTQTQPRTTNATAPHPVSKTIVQAALESSKALAEDAIPTQAIAIRTPLPEQEHDVVLPLAASLPLQEVIHPETFTADAMSNWLPNPTESPEVTTETTHKAKDRDYQNVMEEIAQFDQEQPETTIANLSQYVSHANPMVRATVALTLGELAANNQGHLQAEVVALLNELLQDSNSEVQLQAAAAIGKLQLPLDPA